MAQDSLPIYGKSNIVCFRGILTQQLQNIFSTGRIRHVDILESIHLFQRRLSGEIGRRRITIVPPKETVVLVKTRKNTLFLCVFVL